MRFEKWRYRISLNDFIHHTQPYSFWRCLTSSDKEELQAHIEGSIRFFSNVTTFYKWTDVAFNFVAIIAGTLIIVTVASHLVWWMTNK